MSNCCAGAQQSSMSYPSNSRGWLTAAAISTEQHGGAISQTARSKRRRRSSSDDEERNSQEDGGRARGRDHSPPPARRPRIEPETVSTAASPLCPPLTFLRTGTHPRAAHYQPQSEQHHGWVFQRRCTLLFQEILSIGEDKQSKTPASDSMAGTRRTNRALPGI
jgi:hypothetical protein